MYTVYGIYDEGSLKPIYIGCTKRDLRERALGHLAHGLWWVPSITDNTPFGKKVKAMRDARAGLRKLEMRAIVRVQSKAIAYKIEKALIVALQPECNTKGLELIRKAA